MPTDRTPVSDDKTLYITPGYSSYTMEDLRCEAMNHFDLDKVEAEVQLDIAIENIQVRGCMCHHDHSDWELYFVITRNTPGKVLSSDAELVASACEDAYSAGNYPNGHWAKCAQELLDRGLDIEEAEAFLRSKHMRWCYDNARDSCNATVVDFREYLEDGRNIRGTLKQEAQAMMD